MAGPSTPPPATEPLDGAVLNPLSYPSDRADMARTFQQRRRRIWLRLYARLLEWLTDILPKELNYSDVTPRLAVGGAFRNHDVKALKRRGVTAVVDCREEASDDPALLAQAGMRFLRLPAPDRYALTYDQLHTGVDWVLDQLDHEGLVFMHCEHGVGRGPLMACAVLVAQGYSAPEALKIVRAGRWQAMPNDRQLEGLLNFEQEWRDHRGSGVQGAT